MTILVAALGRRGSDCVARLAQEDPRFEVAFLDTDREDLARRPTEKQVLLGSQLPPEEWTRNDSSFSFGATMAERDRLTSLLGSAQAVVVVAGLGGGTGAGGARALVSLAKEQHLPVVAVVTHPFTLEGEARVARARRGFRDLRPLPDLVISFHQDRVLPFTERFTRLRDTVGVVDQCVVEAIEGLVPLLADLPQDRKAQAFLSDHSEGLASFGIADRPAATGRATKLALANPFLAGVSWDRTEALWLEITSREQLGDEALDQARAVMANQLGGKKVPLEIRTRHLPQGAAPLHLRLYALGDFGQPQPSGGDFFIPGPTG